METMMKRFKMYGSNVYRIEWRGRFAQVRYDRQGSAALRRLGRRQFRVRRITRSIQVYVLWSVWQFDLWKQPRMWKP